MLYRGRLDEPEEEATVKTTPALDDHWHQCIIWTPIGFHGQWEK